MYFLPVISIIVGGIGSSGQAERGLLWVPTARTTDITTKFRANAKFAVSELGWLTATIESMGQPCVKTSEPLRIMKSCIARCRRQPDRVARSPFVGDSHFLDHMCIFGSRSRVMTRSSSTGLPRTAKSNSCRRDQIGRGLEACLIAGDQSPLHGSNQRNQREILQDVPPHFGLQVRNHGQDAVVEAADRVVYPPTLAGCATGWLGREGSNLRMAE